MSNTRIICQSCASLLEFRGPISLAYGNANECGPVAFALAGRTNLRLSSNIVVTTEFLSNDQIAGSCGTATLGEEGGEPVFVETVSIPSAEVKIAEAFQHECEALKTLIHPRLPRLLRHAVKGQHFSIVLQHSEGITLFDYINSNFSRFPEPKKRPSFDFEDLLHIARQIAVAVAFMHLQRPFPIIHRNLNPLNIRVIKPHDEIQLLDFGFLSCFNPERIGRQPKNLISISTFNDPCLLKDLWADTRVDVYSFGMVLRFLLSALSPEESENLPRPADTNPADSPNILRTVKEIADQCCSANPQDRHKNMIVVSELLKRIGTIEAHVKAQLTQCPCGYDNRVSARFCGNCGQSIRVIPKTHVPSMSESQFLYDGEPETTILTSYRENRISSLSRYRMMQSIHEIASDPGFEELLSLPNLPDVAKMQHQKDAVLRALKQMRGRALLADEVGLGKTVEAGIFLKELLLRKLVEKVLIVCPSSLLAAQWQSELYEKFGEIALVFGHDVDSSLAWECSSLIATYDVLAQPFHAEEVLRQRYDLVILDEAHFLNEQEHAGILEIVKALQKKYFLMLSATPMHRSLEELYNIVSLLRPGHFSDLDSFRRDYMVPGDEMQAKNENTITLRKLLHQIMIRNRRKDVVDYVFPKRKAVLRQLTLLPEANQFYQEFRSFLKTAVVDVTNITVLDSIADLAERLCSSPHAFSKQVNQLRRNRKVRQVLGEDFLYRMDDYAARCPDSIVQPKIQAAVEFLTQHSETGQRSLAFSQFDETARYFYSRLQTTNLKALCFHYDPQSSLAARQNAIRKLEETPGGILICPGEASEGLNLQAANLMVNLDLPWNPMKLEQRIGRIQRIGGKRDVLIVNLVLRGTIEEKIYEICDKRIQMFEAIVGHVEEILGNLEEDIEVLIRNFYLDREVLTDEGEELTAEENLSRNIDEAESKSLKPAEESLSTIYGLPNFDPALAEEEEE